MASAVIRRPQLPALTSVRFFAASAVLVYHLTAAGLLSWPKAITTQGFTGVSFFFVLSGFILVYSHSGLPFETRRFYWQRFARIYPALAFSLLIALPMLLFILRMPDMFGWAAAHFKLTVAACLLLLQAWFPYAALAWNGVTWSLSVEAFFYLLFPMLMRRLEKSSARQLVAITAVAWLVSLALAILYLKVLPDGKVPLGDGPIPYFWKAALKFNPSVHLPEFLMGMTCGLLFLRRTVSTSRGIVAVALGMMMLAFVLIFARQIPYLLIHSGLLAPVFAAIIVGLATRPPWAGWLEHSFLVALGNASYSLYLLHFTIILYVFMIMRVPFAVLSGLGCVVGLIVASLLVYRFIEEPARRWLAPPQRVSAIGLRTAGASA